MFLLKCTWQDELQHQFANVIEQGCQSLRNRNLLILRYLIVEWKIWLTAQTRDLSVASYQQAGTDLLWQVGDIDFWHSERVSSLTLTDISAQDGRHCYPCWWGLCSDQMTSSSNCGDSLRRCSRPPPLLPAFTSSQRETGRSLSLLKHWDSQYLISLIP